MTAKKNNEYVQAFKRQNYDDIRTLAPKGTRERLKAAAARLGYPSVNALLNELISDAIARAESPQPLPEDRPAPSDRQETKTDAGGPPCHR